MRRLTASLAFVIVAKMIGALTRGETPDRVRLMGSLGLLHLLFSLGLMNKEKVHFLKPIFLVTIWRTNAFRTGRNWKCQDIALF